MKASWTKGLSADEKKEAIAEFKAAAYFRDHLSKLLADKMDDQNRVGRTAGGYDSPNWALRQADVCGYNRALADAISLIE